MSATFSPTAVTDLKDIQDVERLMGRIKEARAAVGEVIFGQEAVVDEVLVTLLAGGHALLIG
ncbi:MAG TPA: AAA family ATPase, partial [Rhodospirillum rubrum]|nr:AAA family ATPase [Rhodospirillum rubrum]